MINLMEAARRNPSYLEIHIYLTGCLVRQGDGAGADWEAQEILAIQPDFSVAALFETYPMLDASQVAALSTDLMSAGLEEFGSD